MPRARSAAPSCSRPKSKSYHGPGTCTFYGTANSNQMLMEIMGLHMPGASFVNPGTPLRDALTREAAKRALAITALGNDYTPVGRMIDERSIVNGVVGLHATGGSTNHTIHLIAMAAAAGIALTWQDISDLSDAVPLLARVYPNGLADVNHFHAAGGMGFLIRELLDAGPAARGCADRLGRRACGPTRSRRSSARTAASCASRRRQRAATRRCWRRSPRRSSRPAG